MELYRLFSQFHSKMENAEVLEMTVKKVEDILKNRDQGMLGSVELESIKITSQLGFSFFMFRPCTCSGEPNITVNSQVAQYQLQKDCMPAQKAPNPRW